MAAAARAGWLAAALALACRGERSGSAPPVAAVVVEVDSSPRERVRVTPGEIVDLWPLCARHRALALVARGRGGSYTRAPCDRRHAYRLHLSSEPGTGAAVVSLLAATGAGQSLIARTAGVHSLLVERRRAVPLRSPPRALVLRVDGAPARQLAAGELASLLEGGQRGQPAIRLQRLIAGLGLRPAAVARVRVTGERDLEIDGSALVDPAQAILLRHNRRGRLRFSHRQGGRERARLGDVVAIDLLLRRGAAPGRR